METKLKSRYLQEFIQEITYNNRNPKDIKALSLMDDISTNPERMIYPGEKLFRCRIIKKGDAINQKVNFYGFDDKGSFVPPPVNTRDLRANYRISRICIVQMTLTSLWLKYVQDSELM